MNLLSILLPYAGVETAADDKTPFFTQRHTADRSGMTRDHRVHLVAGFRVYKAHLPVMWPQAYETTAVGVDYALRVGPRQIKEYSD